MLVAEGELTARVAELGRAIARDYARENPVLVGVLQGAVPFVADLMRALPIDLTVDFIRASSYGAGTSSSGTVRLVADLAVDVADRHVLIVDDIVDTGLTLGALKRMLEARRPRSVRTCVLLDKAGRRETDVTIDYLGFTIPNVFVVGYGLDYDELYRNLPYVAALDAIWRSRAARSSRTSPSSSRRSIRVGSSPSSSAATSSRTRSRIRRRRSARTSSNIPTSSRL